MERPDYFSILPNVVRPERPRLDEARDATRDVFDPGEAWETLAARGVIPLHWVGDAGRAFATESRCGNCGGRAWSPPCEACGGRGRVTAVTQDPPTVRTCVAFAANPEGVATAEALAREVVLRLAPFGAAAASRCVWYGVRADEWKPGRDPFAEVREAAAALLPPRVVARTRAERDAIERARPSGGRPPWAAVARFADHAWGAELWRELAAPGARWSDREDPFAPAMRLWATGYAIHEVRDGAITLVAPEM